MTSIDPSLAKGMRKRELRRLNDVLLDQAPPVRGTRKAWLKATHGRVMKMHGDYIVHHSKTGTKPANTEHTYLILAPMTEPDDYLAFELLGAEMRGKDCRGSIGGQGVYVTHHAFDRLIQSVGIKNTKQAVRTLHTPLVFAMMREHKKRGETIHACNRFGVFIFESDGENWTLKTIIKADALEGRKRRDWEKLDAAGWAEKNPVS